MSDTSLEAIDRVLSWAQGCVPFPSDCHTAIKDLRAALDAAPQAAVVGIDQASGPDCTRYNVYRDGNWHAFDTPEEASAFAFDLTPAPSTLSAAVVEALEAADAALSGANMNMKVVERKVKAALASLRGKPA